MSLTEKLDSINTKLKSVLSDINTALVAKGATEVTTLDEIPTAIESMQNSGESTAIDYPEWGFTRPSWWLPRPELTEGADEVWALCEFSADLDSYEGVDLTGATVVENGKKQIWVALKTSIIGSVRYLSNGASSTNREPLNNCIIELLLNSTYPVSITYGYQNIRWKNLKIISGSAFVAGAYLSDGLRWSYDFKVIDCPVLLKTTNGFVLNSGLFKNTAIEKIPTFTLHNNETYTRGAYMFQSCYSLKSGRIENWNALSNTFNGCVNLEEVSFSADCSGLSTTTFSGCTLLEKVSVDEGFSASLYIHQSTLYTAEVLHAIIENLADMTGQTAPTFQIGETNIAKLDEEHITMLETKNWNYL